MPDNSASNYNAGPDPELAMTPWSIMSATKPDSSFRKTGEVSESFLFPEHRRPQGTCTPRKIVPIADCSTIKSSLDWVVDAVKHDEFTDLEVPVIDMANEDDAAVVAQVRDACINWGFFQIENHGIDEQLLNRLVQQAEKFFSLPYSQKEKVCKPPGKFAGYGHATVKEGEVRPWSEGFYFTDPASTAALADKIWPPGTNNDFAYVIFYHPPLL